MTAVRLHHAVVGPAGAPAVVLSNSLGTSLAMWDPQVGALAQRFRVIRYDMRGHGRSPAPAGPYTIDDLGADLVGLLDDLGIPRAHHCGLSLGGMVGLWLAANEPARLDRLVTISSSARFPNPDRYRERAAAVRSAGMAPIVESIVSRWVTPQFAAEHPGWVTRLAAMLGAMQPEGYASSCAVVAETDLTASLPSIAAPTLVIAAADDLAVPPEHSQLLASRIPGATIAMLAAAAHLANIERPEAVASLILHHLSGGERPRGAAGPERTAAESRHE